MNHEKIKDSNGTTSHSSKMQSRLDVSLVAEKISHAGAFALSAKPVRSRIGHFRVAFCFCV